MTQTLTLTADLPTPTWGILRAGTPVVVAERLPGRFLLKSGRAQSALMSADEIAAVTR